MIAGLLHDIQRFQVVRPRPVPFPRIGPKIPQIRQRGADPPLIPLNLLELEHFLVVALRLLAPAADGADIPKIAERRSQRPTISAQAIMFECFLIANVCFGVVAPRKMLVSLAIELFGVRIEHDREGHFWSNRSTACLAPVRIELPSPTRIVSKLYFRR